MRCFYWHEYAAQSDHNNDRSQNDRIRKPTFSPLQVNLDSQAEMVHPGDPVLKEREVTLAFRDPQEPSCHQR